MVEEEVLLRVVLVEMVDKVVEVEVDKVVEVEGDKEVEVEGEGDLVAEEVVDMVDTASGLASHTLQAPRDQCYGVN